ncbi:MAG: acyl-ACP--UDP-N-acetylglucosamine O-acyltransferase [Ignavibacteriales bacterium]|nr:MAG: acyl-ACP--UDP-N-acetylglucosamine O-acyltransferase [Ignavibacteriales bacterium]
MNIHPTAVIESTVKLGSNVEVGAHAVIKGDVEIGDNSIIKDNSTIYGPLKMGTGNIIHPGVVLGNVSQDLKYKGEASQVIIGDNNSIRECVTIHQGTSSNKGKTIVGNNNLLMAYTHVAHDCALGSNIIIANGTQLAGHVHIDDFAYIGGLVGVHQFTTIGKNCLIGFMSRINKDVPPFVTVEGNPSKERFINVIGLKRKNYSPDEILLLKKAFNILFLSGKTLKEKQSLLSTEEFKNDIHVKELLDSVLASARGKNGRALEAFR